MKENCWEFNKCGREPEGKHVSKLGACPAATRETVNGVYGGKNGGRCCWVIAGTLCEGKIQGTFAQKYSNCRDCDFLKKVIREEEKITRLTC